MGKPGGFFKKLKSKQQKQTAKKARGTSGAAKSDRIRKHNDAVDFYAAQRLADQLDNVSDTSSESSQESGDEMDDALGMLRKSLGIAQDVTVNEDDELPLDSDDDESVYEEVEVDEDGLEDDGDDEENEGEDAMSHSTDNSSNEVIDDNEESFDDVASLDNIDRTVLLESYVLKASSSTIPLHRKDPFWDKYHKDTHGLPDTTQCTEVPSTVAAIQTLASAKAAKLLTSVPRSTSRAKPVFVHEALWEKWCEFRAKSNRDALTPEETAYLRILQCYSDMLDTTRTFENAKSKMELNILHLLNHWFKSSAITASNDALLGARDDEEEFDTQHRDQGFGKTRLLLCLPLRNIAKVYVELILDILGANPSTCRKLDEFRGDFSEVDEALDPTFKRRPLDYRRQFEGNIDDSFCFGIHLQTSRFQLYSHVLNSDLIICSPLGLRRRVERNGDIMVALSSIEVCVVDEAHVLLMQNWDHVRSLLQLLNKRPKDTTQGLNNLERVFPWALEGKSGRHRQTIVVSEVSHAIISATARSSKNNSGRVIWQSATYDGVLGQVLVPLRQHFLRFNATSAETSDDERFNFFTTEVMRNKIGPLLERKVRTILFIPSYFDFVKVRSFLHREYREQFAAISEYSSQRELRRALGQFTDNERTLLVITERFYFFKRYFVKLAEVLHFYSPPVFAKFYPHLVGKLQVTPNSSVMMSFCRFDTHELNRLCGTTRTMQLLMRESDAYSFVTQ